MEAILEELAREQISPLDEAERTLKREGPDPDYILTFTDPGEKINSIVGLNKRNLRLVFQVEEMGSIATFVEAEERDKIDILLQNGFQAGIQTTDIGDTTVRLVYNANQSYRMLLDFL